MKRSRTQSPDLPSSSSSSSLSADLPPSLKIRRASAEPPSHASRSSLKCTLPPTCCPPSRATTFNSALEMERHHMMFHTYVCNIQGCKAVFPDVKFLELHFLECHDPLMAIRKERGEKTFSCYQSNCLRKFLTPKSRRLHLISVHGYPKEYFFAITNKGISGLVGKWGEGVSMLRNEWKPRPDTGGDTALNKSDNSDDMAVDDLVRMTPNGPPPSLPRPRDSPPHLSPQVPSQPQPQQRRPPRTLSTSRAPPAPKTNAPELDILSSHMSSLSLVPPSIRFGRGGKKGGFARTAA